MAVAVGLQAVADGVAPRRSEAELREAVRATRWEPGYDDV
jgi:hypothetical protein